MALSQMLGVPRLAILDLDALMHIERNKIKWNDREAKTSVVFSALWRIGKLNLITAQILLSEIPNGEWYDNSRLESFRRLSRENGIFVFSTDLEGVMQSSTTCRESKPLKALERILELIKKENIPSEFFEMCEFLKERTQTL
jgi:hypothetical protein